MTKRIFHISSHEGPNFWYFLVKIYGDIFVRHTEGHRPQYALLPWEKKWGKLGGCFAGKMGKIRGLFSSGFQRDQIVTELKNPVHAEICSSIGVRRHSVEFWTVQ